MAKSKILFLKTVKVILTNLNHNIYLKNNLLLNLCIILYLF
jgi:hypothetical protein